jgi:hypothetical protein
LNTLNGQNTKERRILWIKLKIDFGASLGHFVQKMINPEKVWASDMIFCTQVNGPDLYQMVYKSLVPLCRKASLESLFKNQDGVIENVAGSDWS